MQYSSPHQGMGGGANGNGQMQAQVGYSQQTCMSTNARVPPLSSDSHSHALSSSYMYAASSSYVATAAVPSPTHRGYGASGPNPFFEGQLGSGAAGVGVPATVGVAMGTGGPFGNLASGGGGSPEELVASAQQSVHAVANEVMRLERNVGIATISDVEKTELRLEQARSMLREAMDSAGLGALFRQKASHQMQEAQSLSEALVRLRRNITLVAQRGVERQALLGDRGSKVGAGNAAKSSLSDMAHLKNERESLIHSATKLRNLVSESNAILGALKGQGDTMQGTHNRLAVDFLEAIGIGNHTLLQIARTTKLDALVVYIGIGLTMLLMLYILFK